MTKSYRSTLRERIITRRDQPSPQKPLDIPDVGPIDGESVVAIQWLATRVKAGDLESRDLLYTSLQPRLHRIAYVLRPWPNTDTQVGIWDRDDVQQECWIVYAELLAAWNGELPFVPYLLSRFVWRLRDRVLRGIGKPRPPIGVVRIPETLLADLLVASDSDQPESAMLAARLLHEILHRTSKGGDERDSGSAMIRLLQSPRTQMDDDLLSNVDDPQSFSQIEAA